LAIKRIFGQGKGVSAYNAFANNLFRSDATPKLHTDMPQYPRRRIPRRRRDEPITTTIQRIEAMCSPQAIRG